MSTSFIEYCTPKAKITKRNNTTFHKHRPTKKRYSLLLKIS